MKALIVNCDDTITAHRRLLLYAHLYVYMTGSVEACWLAGHFPAESLPGHEHKGGDSRVDQPHRGSGQGEFSPGCKQKQSVRLISGDLCQLSD